MRDKPVARPVALPHSVEAEQAVIGSLLIDPKAWAAVTGRLQPQDFYRADHRLIFAAIAAIAGAGTACDVVMVSQRLERVGKLEAAGGLAYLSTLARQTPSAANVYGYADVVRERATLRGLAALAQDLERGVGVVGEHTAAELIARHQTALLDLQARSRIGKGLVSSRDLAAELIDDLDRRREAPRGLSVGLSNFDELTAGLEPGDLVVIAARPGMGKTALLVSIASYVSAHVPVAVFSAEMPSHQLMRRAASLAAGVPQGRLRRSEQLTDSDWAAISPALSEIAELRLSIDDTALPALAHIRAESLALKARQGLGLVMIDYVQLVQGRGKNRYEELRDVAYGLKAMAKDLAVPVIVLAQLNRGVESRDQKRPHLSDLRDSGAIEEAADIVGLLYSEGYYDREFSMPYVLECHLEKNRNGERGECLWHFSGQYSRVTVLEPGARLQYVRHMQGKQRQNGRGNDL
jgi:replicative DNA helicase